MRSLYIHIPFCVSKCPYCGFYSTVYGKEPSELFLSALQNEIELHRASVRAAAFDTLYVGGGTPTCLSPLQLDRLFGLLFGSFHFTGRQEFTVEANPNTLSHEHLELFRNRGVNRLSIGMQSFSDETLRSLGRAHAAAAATKAFMLARGAGFRNISIDLIYGIPGQDLEQWRNTLQTALDCGPEHVSIYSLSIEEGTPFARMVEAGTLCLPDEELTAAQYEAAADMLEDAGLVRYELSNFARPGFECRHNLNYWERGEYLGLGPGAHSFLNGVRRASEADLDGYARRLKEGAPAAVETEVLSPDQAAQEYLFLRLRTSRGIPLAGYRESFGAEAYERLIRNAAPVERSGLISLQNGRLFLTRTGTLLADAAVRELSR